MIAYQRRLSVAACVAALALPGCSTPSGAGLSAADSLPAERPLVISPSNGKIKHIIVIIQENRSFVNLFAGFPGADAPTFGYLHDGTKVALKPVSLKNASDLPHGFFAALMDWNGGAMNGYDAAAASFGYQAHLPYSYVLRGQVKPYWDLASQYTLADRMFETEWGGSFTAHLDLIAGTAGLTPTQAEVDFPSGEPWGCDAPAGTTTALLMPSMQEAVGPFPCFTFPTMADALDDAKVSWKYYAPEVGTGIGDVWSEFDAIHNVRYGQDWNRVIFPETTFLADAKEGLLPSVSWVVPDWRNSDHGGSKSDSGPGWVAAVVNAVGQSKEWDSTAIFVVWDDWGGWYDDAKPPQYSYIGLGNRVPCIVISPYAKPHHVSHTLYEFGSILKFMEETFALPSLQSTDQRSASMADSFNFRQRPRQFEAIRSSYSPDFLMHQRPSLREPDAE